MTKNLVVVTGGCGYIGSHTVVELLNQGYDVVSIDNYSRSSSLVLEHIKAITGVSVRNYDIDLCNEVQTTQLFASLSDAIAVIHFAAFKSVPESISCPDLYFKNNILSLINVLQGCTLNHIKNIVFSSSCSVYGDIPELPVSETSPLSTPKSPYASTKIMGEQILRSISKAYNLYTVSLRYFNPAGAHPSGLMGEMPLYPPDNLVPVITQTAIGKRDKMYVYGGSLNTRDGSCIRDYIHVMDIASAHVKAIEYLKRSGSSSDIINLGSGTGISVLEAINAFEHVSKVSLNFSIAPPRDGDVVAIYSDVSKAKRLLEWHPHYNIFDMMQSAWKWELELDRKGKSI